MATTTSRSEMSATIARLPPQGQARTCEMELEAHVDPFGEPSERPLLLACINSYFESGVDNPVDEDVR